MPEIDQVRGEKLEEALEFVKLVVTVLKSTLGNIQKIESCVFALLSS